MPASSELLHAAASSGSLEFLLERLQQSASLPLSRAESLAPGFYTSSEFFDWEVDTLFRSGWICLGHSSQIPTNGDFFLVDLLGEPLVIVRDKSGIIRVLSRVCPHRAMDILPPGFGYDGHGPAVQRDGTRNSGSTRLFLCPYHSWVFELDGRLKGCAEMHEAEGFSRDDWGLHEYASVEWMGFIFVNLEGNNSSDDFPLVEASDDLGDWQPDEMEVVVALEWDCPFNWKVLVENFMESYHHLGAHLKTLQPILPARDTWSEAEKRHHIRAHLPLRLSQVETSAEVFPPLPTLPAAKAAEWALFLGFPNFLLFGGPDRLIWYRIDPVDAERSKLLTTVLVPSSYKSLEGYESKRQAAEQNLRTFHLEDMEMCEAVQRGFHSRVAGPGRLSHLEMPIWLFQRFLAARARGVWPTDDMAPAPAQR